MSPVLFVVNVGILMCAALLVYGLLARRCFALGRWYEYSHDKGKYIQSIIGYLLLLGVLMYGRIMIVSAHG